MLQSHFPLYRKYRPQTLAQLVGQASVAQALSHAIEMKRIAHAYLFTGPRGTGKTSSARILAKSLNCQQGPTATPCQTCDSCINITEGHDLDVIEFDAASNGGVEDARDLIESCQFAPMGSGYKIYIIDEIHMLSTQAFNALLKTLEEPPNRVVFIFATTEAHKVLPTIVSRCQQFHFNRISTPAIHQHLIQVCQMESLNIEADALLHLARQARGGLRDALSTLDQTAVLARSQSDPFTLAALIEFLGEVPEEQMIAHLKDVLEEDCLHVLSYLDGFNRGGIEARQVLQPLMLSLRHVLVAASVGIELLSPEDLDTSEAVLEAVKTLAPRVTPAQITGMMNALHRLEQELRSAQDPALTLEVGLLAMTLKTFDTDLSPLIQRIDALEAQVKALSLKSPSAYGTALPTPSMPTALPPTGPPAYHPSLAPAPLVSPAVQTGTPLPHPSSPSQPTASPRVTLAAPTPSPTGNLQDLHQRICHAIRSGAARPLFLQHVHILSQDASKIVLSCKSPALLKMMQTPDKLGQYKEAAAHVLGQDIHIAFNTSSSAPLPTSQTRLDAPSLPSPTPMPSMTLASPLVTSREASPSVTMPPTVVQSNSSPLASMPSLLFEEILPAPSENPPPLWEDERSTPPLSPPPLPNAPTESGPLILQGSGENWEESRGFVTQLLQATDLEATSLGEELIETIEEEPASNEDL
jgi:DNA polymerase-3 subunit gamma/tau